MTAINLFGSTFDGTAEADHGVFTHSNGTVYAGSNANGCARFGVATNTSGTTTFVECDADGNVHGRYLVCTANGDVAYCLYEHGEEKEYAALCADGTCKYNAEVCSADFAPFVQLQAKVLPIKARPH